jgi:hypothetical protein
VEGALPRRSFSVPARKRLGVHRPSAAPDCF